MKFKNHLVSQPNSKKPLPVHRQHLKSYGWHKIGHLLYWIAFLGILSNCTLERELIRPQKNLSQETPVYYEFIAQKYYNQRDYEKSIHQYQRLIQKFSSQPILYDTSLAWANYEIGFCYLLMKDYDQALIYFKKVIDQYDQNVSKILASDRINEIKKILASKS